MEDAAKFNVGGIWASRFMMPWDWRRGKRMAPTKIEAPFVADIDRWLAA